MASIGAFQLVPALAASAGTKAYVLSLIETLAEELKGTGVTVMALRPGIKATGMLSHAAHASAKAGKLPGLIVGDVDAAGYAACMRGEVIKALGAANLAATMAARALPKWLLRRVAGMVSRKAFLKAGPFEPEAFARASRPQNQRTKMP